MPEDITEFLGLLRDVIPQAHLYWWRYSQGLSSIERSGCDEIVDEQDAMLIASLDEIQLPVTSMNDLLELSPGALFIDIPRVEKGSLREIVMGAKAWNLAGERQLKTWEKFFRKVRSSLISGAFVFMPETGKGRYYKNAHATHRAITASTSGIKLKSVAGNSEFDYKRLAA